MGFRSLRSRVRKLESAPPSPVVTEPPDWVPNAQERKELYLELIECYARGKFLDDRGEILILLWNDKMVEEFAEDVLERIRDYPPEKAEPIKRRLLEAIGGSFS